MEFPPAAQNLMSDFLFAEAICSIVAKVEIAKKIPFANVKKISLDQENILPFELPLVMRQD